MSTNFFSKRLHFATHNEKHVRSEKRIFVTKVLDKSNLQKKREMRVASKDRGEREILIFKELYCKKNYLQLCRYHEYHEILTLAKKKTKQQNQKTGFTLLFMYINIVKI